MYEYEDGIVTDYFRESLQIFDYLPILAMIPVSYLCRQG